MQTIYYTTTNFIRHTGNVIDLGEYRRKRAMAQQGSLAPQLEPAWEDGWEPEAEWERPAPAEEARTRRSARRERQAWALDICASLGVLAVTLSLTLRVLMM